MGTALSRGGWRRGVATSICLCVLGRYRWRIKTAHLDTLAARLFANPNQDRIVIGASKRVRLEQRPGIVLLVVVEETWLVRVDMPRRNTRDILRQ